jgi:predicted heme/steroid binding protein/uncharacterized membrane protein
MKEMTSEELLLFNGKDGKPVYVAFQGRVYDVTQSRLWGTGSHMKRHPSGKDLTGEIAAAPHGPEVLDRYPQVGFLKSAPSEELNHLPPWLQNVLERFPSLRRHPHPMVVHFPIAFLMGASLFILLYLFLRHPSLEMTSFFLLLLGALASPFAMATGLLTWWINYRLKLSYFVKRKLQLSALLLALELILVLWRSTNPATPPEEVYSVYAILMLILTPVVGLLGYYGGQMTFPSEKE